MDQGFTSSWRSLKNQDTASRKIYTLLKLNRGREREREHTCGPKKQGNPKEGQRRHKSAMAKKLCIKTMASKWLFKSNTDLIGDTLNWFQNRESLICVAVASKISMGFESTFYCLRDTTHDAKEGNPKPEEMMMIHTLQQQQQKDWSYHVLEIGNFLFYFFLSNPNILVQEGIVTFVVVVVKLLDPQGDRCSNPRQACRPGLVWICVSQAISPSPSRIFNCSNLDNLVSYD